MHPSLLRRTLCRTAVLALLAPLAGGGVAAPPAAMQGVVTQVIDGSLVRFTPAGQPAFELRLRDIEAPESCQPGAAEARVLLASLVLNKPATLLPAGRDRQGRLLGALSVEEVNVGRRMVEEGYAWSIRTRNDIGPYVKEERMAKALGRGVHGQAGAVAPREWRRTKGVCP